MLSSPPILNCTPLYSESQSGRAGRKVAEARRRPRKNELSFCRVEVRGNGGKKDIDSIERDLSPKVFKEKDPKTQKAPPPEQRPCRGREMSQVTPGRGGKTTEID